MSVSALYVHLPLLENTFKVKLFLKTSVFLTFYVEMREFWNYA